MKVFYALFVALVLLGQIGFVAAALEGSSNKALYDACRAGGMDEKQCCDQFKDYPGCGTTGTKLTEELKAKYSAGCSSILDVAGGKKVCGHRIAEEAEKIYLSNNNYITVPKGLRIVEFTNGEIEIQSPEGKSFEVEVGFTRMASSQGMAIFFRPSPEHIDALSYKGWEAFKNKMGNSLMRRRLHVRTATAVAGVRG